MLEWVAFPSPGDLPDPGIEHGSPAFQADALPSEPPGKHMISLDSILKCRDTILPTKFHTVKAMVFPVVMYGSENWTVKKGEPQGLMLLNCGVGEDSRESLGMQGDPSNPS